MWKTKSNPFGTDCAMHPKVEIQPRAIVEADLGPVQTGIDRLNCDPGEILWSKATEGYMGLRPDGKIVWKQTSTADSKPTNPKDAIGSDKLPLDLVPTCLEIYASLGFLEGAVKYGKFNWRVAGVRLSIYIAALKRHLKKFEDGEWADEKTNVPHLSSMLACIGIILDARLVGKLTDDRPPVAPTAELIASLESHVPHLKNLFKDRHPHQHTIMDAKEPE